MTSFESATVAIPNSAEKIFTFLSNFNNFGTLMPEQVSNWTSTEETCSFTINGLATIGMKIAEKVPHTLLRITSDGKVPFEFTLNVVLQSVSPASCTGKLVFEAELNPFIKKMVEKPLTNFVNMLAEKLQEIK